MRSAAEDTTVPDPLLDETGVAVAWPLDWSRVPPASTMDRVGPVFDRIAGLVARTLDAPVALASMADGSRQIVFGAHGVAESGRTQSVHSSYCGLVLASGAPVVVRDGRSNPAVADLAACRDGWIACLGVPVRNQRGEVTASLCALDRRARAWRVSDLEALADFAHLLEHESAERESRQELAEQAKLLDRLINTLPVATYVHDVVAQRPDLIGDGARLLLGYDPQTWAEHTRNPSALMHPDDQVAFLKHLERIAADRSDGVHRFEYRVRHADGSWHWMTARDVAHERDSEGGLTRILGTSMDITERREAEAALQSSEGRLRHILDASGAGTWAWDAATNAEVWDPVFRRQFGFDPEEPATFDNWVARIHPEERDGLLARVERMLATPGDDRWDVEFRVLLPDGAVRWMRGFGRAQRDEQGRVTAITGVNFDVTDAHRAQTRLQESEARLRMAAEVAGLGMMEIDYAAGTATLDARAGELFGLQAGTPLPREAVHARFHSEDRDEIHRRLQACLDPGGSGSFAMEHRVARSDGRIVWLHVKKQVTFGRSEEGPRPATALLVAADVTDRKLAEERERLLGQELAHRSKNLLTLVQAVARQTVSRSAEDFLSRFEVRLQALAASQNLLTEHSWGGVELDALVRQQLAHFGDLLEGRIALGGPSVRLSAIAAQTLGMALHEMATNAGKHGALSGPEGQVQLAWTQDGDRFTLSWRERGGPVVKGPRHKGFGSVVIDRMVRDTLEAVVRLDYAPEGFSWAMDCPVERVMEESGRTRAVRGQGAGDRAIPV